MLILDSRQALCTKSFETKYPCGCVGESCLPLQHFNVHDMPELRAETETILLRELPSNTVRIELRIQLAPSNSSKSPRFPLTNTTLRHRP